MAGSYHGINWTSGQGCPLWLGVPSAESDSQLWRSTAGSPAQLMGLPAARMHILQVARALLSYLSLHRQKGVMGSSCGMAGGKVVRIMPLPACPWKTNLAWFYKNFLWWLRLPQWCCVSSSKMPLRSKSCIQPTFHDQCKTCWVI